MGDDHVAVGEVEAVVEAFLSAFASGPGLDERMAGLRDLFAPGAVVTRLCGDPQTTGVDEFVAPRHRLLGSGEVVDFAEQVGRGRAEVFGDLAHWYGGYTKQWRDDAGAHAGAGVKSVQLARLYGRWRIVSVVWDDERDGLAVPRSLLAAGEEGSEGLDPTYPIETERLRLRPHREDDLDDLLVFHSDPEVTRYVPWPVRDREQTRVALTAKLGQTRLRDEGEWLVLAVERRDTGRVIGEVLLKWDSRTNRTGEIGYAFATDQHGQGLAHEAASAVLRLGFEGLGLHRVTAMCHEDNAASVRLLERLGMHREGHLVEDQWFKGEWVSSLLYATTTPPAG